MILFPLRTQMLEIKDQNSAIKLFGRKIPLPEDAEAAPVIYGGDFGAFDKLDGHGHHGELHKDTTVGKATEIKPADDDDVTINKDDSSNLERGQEASVNPKTPSIDEETAKPIHGKPGNEESETTNSEKTLKKPDKLLPCPRCNSMETKFCYYNNYNVNQPRHFCKACQRYWTAGGTMRNVPVGAGRRKSKNSASYYRHITISEALEAARMEIPNGTHPPKFISNGRVLSFNVDAPNCEPVGSVITLAEKKVVNGLKTFEPLANRKNGEACENRSVKTSTDPESGGRKCPNEPHTQKINGFPSHIPYLHGVPWPYVWNSSVSPPTFFPPGFPMSFYPGAAWNCGVPGPWTTPWFSPQASSPNESLCSDSKSSTLGKHSRDDDLAKEDNNSSKEEPLKRRNGSVLVPKTLRIDDPSEAAKSSIWATLGINNESVSRGSLFRTFQSKGQEKVHVAETSPVLQANPAALSRSLVFHESS